MIYIVVRKIKNISAHTLEIMLTAPQTVLVLIIPFTIDLKKSGIIHELFVCYD